MGTNQSHQTERITQTYTDSELKKAQQKIKSRAPIIFIFVAALFAIGIIIIAVIIGLLVFMFNL